MIGGRWDLNDAKALRSPLRWTLTETHSTMSTEP
jgi:hypothetical protein